MVAEQMDDWPACRRCGGGLEWQDCDNGCDDGYFSLYDEDPLWYDEDDYEPCQICLGKGGWWFCPDCRDAFASPSREE